VTACHFQQASGAYNIRASRKDSRQAESFGFSKPVFGFVKFVQGGERCAFEAQLPNRKFAGRGWLRLCR
jgi:hypothetical protein